MSVIQLTYGPYGQNDTLVGHAPLLGFNGERYESLTRSYALGLGYRNYSPALMRFQGPDDLSPFAEGGLNAYTYCVNDPINLSDTTGHAHNATQLLARMTQKGLKVPSGTSREHHRANKLKRQSPQPTLSASRDTKPEKKVRFNEVPQWIYYSEERSSFKRELFQERKALIVYMEREYRIFELYQRELNALLDPDTEANFIKFKKPHALLVLVTHAQSQLDDAHERLRQLHKTLKSIRL